MTEFENISKIEVLFSTENIPAPYSYQYQFQIDLPETASENLGIKYNLEYTERESLEEDDIYDEGFSMDDDYQWKGDLPPVWLTSLKDLYSKTSWNSKSPKVSEKTSSLMIKLFDKNSSVKELVPANQEQWEYFMQEMTQAVYEVSKKEMPLVVKYKEIDDQKNEMIIHLLPYFSSRTLEVKVEKERKVTEKKEIDWKELQSVLKSVYYPDYDYEHALDKVPSKSGKYIDNGEGLWYEFGIGVKNPDKNINSLERLERSLKELAKN